MALQVLIVGQTASGKTLLANLISQALQDKGLSFSVIDEGDYYSEDNEPCSFEARVIGNVAITTVIG